MSAKREASSARRRAVFTTALEEEVRMSTANTRAKRAFMRTTNTATGSVGVLA
jgi:hypothetical protein